MPPKAKLHKNRGKSELVITPSVSNSDSNASSSSSDDLQEQLETELCWCIQQLQRVLSSGKLNPRQVQENTKVLNTLMNNSAPFIKKRQLMRLTFGDYRAKMMEEDRKLSKAINVKIGHISPSKKSKFVKKAAFSSAGNDFKFAFPVVNSDDLSEEMSKVEIQNTVDSNKFRFALSDNAFRFNFDVDQN